MIVDCPFDAAIDISIISTTPTTHTHTPPPLRPLCGGRLAPRQTSTRRGLDISRSIYCNRRTDGHRETLRDPPSATGREHTERGALTASRCRTEFCEQAVGVPGAEPGRWGMGLSDRDSCSNPIGWAVVGQLKMTLRNTLRGEGVHAKIDGVRTKVEGFRGNSGGFHWYRLLGRIYLHGHPSVVAHGNPVGLVTAVPGLAVFVNLKAHI